MSIVIRTVRAHELETVEIQWTLADGSMHVERRSVPPAAVREALVLDNARNAAGQVTDFLHSNESGQRYMTPPPVIE